MFLTFAYCSVYKVCSVKHLIYTYGVYEVITKCHGTQFFSFVVKKILKNCSDKQIDLEALITKNRHYIILNRPKK